MASEREHYAWDIRQRLGRWNDGALPVMQCIDRLVARADLAEQREAELVECLRWYAEKAHLCRLIHSEGDEGRYALAEDGGQRAYAILAKHKAEGRENDNDER